MWPPTRRLMVVAGEPSADLLVSYLLPSLREHGRFSLHGVYGPHSAAVASRLCIPCPPPLFRPADIAVMGVTTLLPRLPTLVCRATALVNAAAALRPHLALFVDGKGLSRFVAPRIRRRTYGHSRIAQYVAPSIWAWKGGDADVARARAAYDHMLLLFPFEARAWREADVPHTVVGSQAVEAHILDEAAGLPVPKIPRPERGDGMELVVMLGSRAAEVNRHGPLLSRALSQLPRTFLRRLCTITVPLAAPHLADLVHEHVRDWRRIDSVPHVDVVTGREDARRAIARADAGIVASGTAALEVALAGLPVVVVYKTDWLTARIAKSRAKVELAALPNLLAGRAVMQELLFDRCTAETLVGELQLLLASDPTYRQNCGIAGRSAVEGLLADAYNELPSARAARALAPFLFGR